MPNVLFGISRHQPLDVVAEGFCVQIPVRGNEGLLIHTQGRIQLARHLPRQAVDHLQQVFSITLLFDGLTQAQAGDVERQSLSCQLIRIRPFGKVPKHHIVGVQRLRNPDSGGTRGLQIRRKAKMVERIEAIAAADGEKAGRTQTPVQHVRKGRADPVVALVPAAVLEGQHQHKPPMRFARFGGLAVRRLLRARDPRPCQDHQQKGSRDSAKSYLSPHHC